MTENLAENLRKPAKTSPRLIDKDPNVASVGQLRSKSLVENFTACKSYDNPILQSRLAF